MNLAFRSILKVLALVACFAPTAGAQTEAIKASTPSAAVEGFFRAVSDSNLVRMGQLFGTDKGSASVNRKIENWDMRAVVVQTAFAGITVNALAETESDRGHMIVTTQLIRGDCSVTLPVTTVESEKEGWLVRSFDWETAWNGVNTPCVAGRNPGGQ